MPAEPTKVQKQVRGRLCADLKGKADVQCPFGLIDVLTETEVIEVKNVQSWKHALGKVLANGYSYPNNGKRIHLFSDTIIDTALSNHINALCGYYNVRVSFEVVS
jgi:hypothetical protein